MRLYYGWVIVGVSFLTLAVGGSTTASFSVYYVAILKEMGWSRADTALAFSLTMLVFALGGFPIGTLLDRFGPRRLLPAGALVLGVGLLLSSGVTRLWELYLFYGVLVGLGITLIGYIPTTVVISRWFERQRATALGVGGAGRSLGNLLLLPFYQGLIAELGWRSAYRLQAVLIAAVLIPLNLLLQRPPPQRPGPPASPAGDEWTGPRAVRSVEFWLFTALGFLGGINISAVTMHQVAFLVDQGYGAYLAATIAGVLSVTSSAGNIAGGFLADRWGRRAIYSLGAVAAAGGVVVLLLIQRDPLPLLPALYAICYGLGFGMTGSVTTALHADVFGGRHFGAIFGLIQLGSGLGGVLGPWLAGWIFDHLGSYALAFLLILGNILLRWAGVFAIMARAKIR
ncbi:MAG: MFS transporter [Deltaproteobacteria bacterium]|nr:MFS transporter [Deltaproteobacteria bacterium]